MPSSQKLQIRLIPTRQECSFDGPLQSLGFLFRYKMEDGGYTAGLSLTLKPMGKVYQNASSLKPLGQFKPNCPGMIIGRSSTKYRFSMPIGNPRWPPLQKID